MKECKPVIRYQCEYCAKKSIRVRIIREHELECTHSLYRNCISCNNTGVRRVQHFTVTGDWEWIIQNCVICENAARNGGKSYIKEKNEVRQSD